MDERSDPAGGVGARSLLVEFLGAFVRGIGGWFPIAPVVAILGSIGVDDANVRMAVSRLKARGWLAAERRDGVPGYALTPTAVAALEAGDEFIYHDRSASALEEGWVVVAFSIPERLRPKRHALKARLVDAGFGHSGPGVLLAPARLLAEMRRIVADLDVEEFVDPFIARYEGADLSALVRRAWDLEALATRLHGFLSLASPIAQRWATTATPGRGRGLGGDEAVAALRDYLLLLHEWRVIAYSDPGLPRELVGPAWPGGAARELFVATAQALRPSAAQAIAGSGIAPAAEL